MDDYSPKCGKFIGVDPSPSFKGYTAGCIFGGLGSAALPVEHNSQVRVLG